MNTTSKWSQHCKKWLPFLALAVLMHTGVCVVYSQLVLKLSVWWVRMSLCYNQSGVKKKNVFAAINSAQMHDILFSHC